MYYTLLNHFLERLNENCLPPRFTLHQADRQLLLELHLFIRGGVVYLTLPLACHTLCISQTPGCGFCLSIGQVVQKLQTVLSSHICRLLDFIFGAYCHGGKSIAIYPSGTCWVHSDFLKFLSCMKLESFIDNLKLNR
jgi:hypothetical protein